MADSQTMDLSYLSPSHASGPLYCWVIGYKMMECSLLCLCIQSMTPEGDMEGCPPADTSQRVGTIAGVPTEVGCKQGPGKGSYGDQMSFFNTTFKVMLSKITATLPVRCCYLSAILSWPHGHPNSNL
jgi:hypothetical protein